jgi:hypothetical protein
MQTSAARNWVRSQKMQSFSFMAAFSRSTRAGPDPISGILLAVLGFPLGDSRSQIDLVPENPESLKKAAAAAGVTLSEAKRAFLIQGDDRVGAVAATTAKLADANVNITAIAAAAAGAGRYGMILWVAPADYARAADALGA